MLRAVNYIWYRVWGRVQNVKERRNSSYKCIYRKFSGSTSAPPHREAHHVDFKPSLICASSGANFPPTLYLPALSPSRCRAHVASPLSFFLFLFLFFYSSHFFLSLFFPFYCRCAAYACMRTAWFTSADATRCFSAPGVILSPLSFFLVLSASIQIPLYSMKSVSLLVSLSTASGWILKRTECTR